MGSKLKVWRRQRIISLCMNWRESRLEKVSTLVLSNAYSPTTSVFLKHFHSELKLAESGLRKSMNAFIHSLIHSFRLLLASVYYWDWVISNIDKLLSLWTVFQ